MSLRLVLISVLSCLGIVCGAGAGLQPEDVRALTHISGGLVAFPRATADDGRLAQAMAGGAGFIAHLTASDNTMVSKLRDAAETGGLLGRSVYVEQGDAKSLPFASRLVDLLVVTDLRDADLTPELRLEFLRVVAPGRGVVLAGRAAGGPGLTESAVKAWVKDVPGAFVTNSSSGVWAVMKPVLPAGSEPWAHRCHGADNVQVSNDTTFVPPFLPQWWALPRQEGFWGTTVVSGNGRMYTVRGSRWSKESVLLTARSLTSGLVLWQRTLGQTNSTAKLPHGGYVPGRACTVVAGDMLCMIDADSVAVLDGETGSECRRIKGPRQGGQVKWMAVSSNMVAMLAGDPDVMQPISYQTVAANPVGRSLAVYDFSTGKELWSDSLPGDVDERVPAIRGGQLYYLAQGVGVVARELATGREIWRNAEASIQTNFVTPDQKKIGALLGSQPVIVALEDVLVMRTPWAKELITLARNDGKLLWRRKSGLSYRGLQSLPLGGLWIGDGSTLDLKTGEKAAGPKFMSSGCGPTTSVPGYMISCFGAVSEIKSGKPIRLADIKSPCDVGSLVSEGVMVTFPSECACAFEVKSYRALVAAGDVKVHELPVLKDRLTVSAEKAPASMALTGADWPTYRHDPERSGACSAVLSEQAKVLWHFKANGSIPYRNTWNPASGPRLAADFVATDAVAGGGNVYFASHDGVIHCVKADTGKELWKFPTASMMFAPPTLWEGRVFAGGGDGRVYCLDAGTGELLWRLLVAPSERRVFWLGHLISTWPVTGGVVVRDGVGYAVAGYQADGGVYACAFDAKTGAVVWEKHDAGSGNGNPAKAMVNGGGVAVAGDKLCLAGWSSGMFDLKTGNWSAGGGSAFGREVGYLCNQWVIRGGRRLTELERDIESPINGQFQPDVPGVTSLPVWDPELVLFASAKKDGGLVALPSDKYTAGKADGRFRTAVPPAKPVQLEDLKVWSTPPGLIASFGMSSNMAVAAFVDMKKSHRLAAFKRADGAQAWSVDLPEQPAMNKLAIDRDGRVLVSLCDGSVICVGAEK